jgi:enoyl-CoA hydratase/carnithine racemase
MVEAERAKFEVEERGDGVVVTLASGDAGNYLGVEELDVLAFRLHSAENSGKRWVLLRQHGRDFCLGRAPGPTGEDTRKALIGFVQLMQTIDLVTVAAADGGCAGFGVGLFALADISIAADGAWFQFPEILHGPAPAIVASWLYDRVPYKQALYWTMTGEKFGSADAYQFGLASRITPAPALRAVAQQTIETLDSLSDKAIRNCKSAARVMSSAPPDLAVRRALALKWFL